MKIELEEPFKSKWKTGYIVKNSENRKNLCLVNDSVNRTTISYARYLMGVKLGYEVSSEFEVDHKDENKTNDELDNLQLLSKTENIKKSNKNNIIEYSFKCPICGNFFTLRGKQLGQRRDKINPTCSIVCGQSKTASTLQRR